MSSLLSLYFLHPFSNRLANKTQRFNPRYELTNPTKTPPPPFVFSLLSVILLHLYYTLPPPLLHFQSPSPSVTTLRPPVTLSPHTLSPLSSSSVTTPCSHVTLSPLPLLLSPVPLLLCLLLPCHLILCLPCLPSLSCKECLPVLSTGAFTLSKTRPFKHAEHAFLAP